MQLTYSVYNNWKCMLLFIGISLLTTAHGCTSIAYEYQRVGEYVTMSFQAKTRNPDNPGETISHIIQAPDGRTLFTIRYRDGLAVYIESCKGCVFAGNTQTGDLVIMVELQRTDAGTYKLVVGTDDVLACVTVFVLNHPTRPVISAGEDPSVGESITLTCNSNSTTEPSNHGLNLTFTWTVDKAVNLREYSYSNNRNTLTLSSVVKEDANKQFRCKATEDVTEGYTSASSDAYYINVLYGPENVAFNPVNTYYEKQESTNLDPVTCSAECNPSCSFTWTKMGQGIVSSTPVLSLGALTSSEAGTYRCTAERPGATSRAKDLTVNVIYGPEFVILTPGTTDYTVEEGEFLNNVKCYADCFPTCTYKWTKDDQSAAVSNTDTLMLGTVQKSFAGIYTCTARNVDTPSKQMEKHITINVIYGPDNSSTTLSPSTSEYALNKGTVLPNITCSADCYPDCTYTWTKLSQRSSVLLDNDGILTLGSLTPDDAGTYICTAKNQGKSNSPTISKQVVVYVLYGPDTLSCNVQTQVTAIEGDTIQDILCWSDCYPGCSYIWRNVTGDSALSSNGILSFGRANRYMAGLYTITAMNTAPQYSQIIKKNITVIVNSVPDAEDKADRSETDNTTLLIVGVTLGAVCVILAIYSIYVTILYRRGTKRETKSVDRSSNHGNYVNRSFAPDVVEQQLQAGDDRSVHQYADLYRFENSETDTYDVLRT